MRNGEKRSRCPAAVLGALVLAAAACPGEQAAREAPQAPLCVPGEARLCHCPDGRQGSQVCQPDGRALGSCECAAAPVPAAGSSGGAAAPPVAAVVPPPSPAADAGPPPAQLAELPAAPDPDLPLAAMAAPFQPDASTVALWHFDEGSGETARSAGLHDLVAALQTATWIEGRFGRGLFLGGSGSYARIDRSDVLGLSGSLTVEGWIRPETTRDMTVFQAHDGLRLGVKRQASGLRGVIQMRIGDEDRTLVSSSSVSVGSWHHLAGTFDGSTVRIWVDGGLGGELDAPGLPSVVGGCPAATIGADCRGASGLFQGALDEIRISNVARYLGPGGSSGRRGQGSASRAGDGGTAGPAQGRDLTDMARDGVREATKILGL